jgi:hypothetical protein
VRCNCKLCIAISFVPPNILLLISNPRAMTVAPGIRRTFAGHGVV